MQNRKEFSVESVTKLMKSLFPWATVESVTQPSLLGADMAILRIPGCDEALVLRQGFYTPNNQTDEWFKAVWTWLDQWSALASFVRAISTKYSRNEVAVLWRVRLLLASNSTQIEMGVGPLQELVPIPADVLALRDELAPFML